MMRRPLAVWVLFAALAAPTLAYTIVLKDGSTVIARDPYRVDGDQAVITLPNGTRTSLPMGEIDVPATEKANASGQLGDAVVLGEANDTTRLPTPPADAGQGTSLSDVAARRRLGARLEREEGPATPAPTVSAAELPRTPAGNVDLLRYTRAPVEDMDLGNRLSRLLRARGLDNVAIYQGTQPGRLVLEFVTNSEASVFEALEGSAEALLQLTDQGGARLDAIELFMSTDRRVRAGQFLMTPERARQLVGKKIDVPTFFVRYVEF